MHTLVRHSNNMAGEAAAFLLSQWDMRPPATAKAVALGFAGWKPGLGGARNHLRAISANSRHSIRLIPGDAATRLAHRGRYASHFIPRLERADLAKFEVVHSHVDPLFIRGCARAKARGSRWIHTYHSLYFEEAWGPLEAWQLEINRALTAEARHADRLIAVSGWLQSFLRETYGIETIHIPNGVDVSACDNARGGRFTERTGLAGFVVFVGSLNEVKNPRLFIELAAKSPNDEFVMIGKNLTTATLEPWYGTSLPANLRAVGPLSHSGTLDAIAASSIMVMPSNFEGLPTALMEAMALGKPVVASDAFGCRDAIGNETCGVLVEPRSLEALRRGLDEAHRRRELGPNAAKRVRELFDWKVVIRQLDDIYSEQLGMAPGG
jgi:glycosyltransferase involved in cell wall biosynthesis